MANEPMEVCGRHARSTGEPCQNRAGKGTDHLGTGACKFHGGNAKTTHGRFSKVKRQKLAELIDQYMHDPDPLDVLPEVATLRALIADKLESEDAPKAAEIAYLLEALSKAVKRVRDADSTNHIPRGDFLRVTQEMGRVVDEVMHDVGVPLEEKAARIRELWLEIRVR